VAKAARKADARPRHVASCSAAATARLRGLQPLAMKTARGVHRGIPPRCRSPSNTRRFGPFGRPGNESNRDRCPTIAPVHPRGSEHLGLAFSPDIAGSLTVSAMLFPLRREPPL